MFMIICNVITPKYATYSHYVVLGIKEAVSHTVPHTVSHTEENVFNLLHTLHTLQTYSSLLLKEVGTNSKEELRTLMWERDIWRGLSGDVRVDQG